MKTAPVHSPKEAFEFADTIYQLATRGFIRATSVGFIPTATEEVDEKKREKCLRDFHNKLQRRTDDLLKNQCADVKRGALWPIRWWAWSAWH